MHNVALFVGQNLRKIVRVSHFPAANLNTNWCDKKEVFIFIFLPFLSFVQDLGAEEREKECYTR